MGTRWTPRSPPGWPTGCRRPAHGSHPRSPWTARPWVAPPSPAADQSTSSARSTTPPARCSPTTRWTAPPEEVTGFQPLLAGLELTGVTVTADALHTKRDAAKFLVTDKHAHDLLTVKPNQPTLHAQ